MITIAKELDLKLDENTPVFTTTDNCKGYLRGNLIRTYI